MTFEQIVESFAEARALPREAIQAALDGWDEFGPRFSAMLASYAAGADVSERTERALFVAIHLLAERHDQTAFAPLCRLLRDDEVVNLVFGIDIHETLPGLLINTFSDDLQPLKALIEDDGADELIRGDALTVLAWLAAAGRIGEAAARSYFLDLRQSLKQAASHVWYGWAMAVALARWDDMTDAAEALFRTGLVPAEMMDPATFRPISARMRAEPDRLAAFAKEGTEPFGTMLEKFADWTESPAYPAPLRVGPAAPAYQDDWVPQEPVRNPLRHVGRNDPCPCGSGKKHKKCCLA